MSRAWMMCLALLLVGGGACGGGGESPAGGEPGPGPDEPSGPDAGPDDDDIGEDGCQRPSPTEGGSHLVIVGHPYTASGQPGKTYEILDLSADGELRASGRSFEMRRPASRRIRFTSDGAIGIVAQDDGSLGVFRLSPGGVEVVHPGFAVGFYAADVWIEPGDQSALVLDPNWRNNGGGLYRVAIACDGSLTPMGLVVESKRLQAFQYLGDGRAAVAARDIDASPMDKDVHLISLSDSGAVAAVASGDAFTDDDAIHSAMEVTPDGAYAVVGDITEFSAVGGNRIGVMALGASSVDPVQVVDIEDPYDILVSPFGNAVAVASGYGNAIYALPFDGALAHPLGTATELSYTGAAPALPGRATMLSSGPLAGLALVTENVSVRRIRFESSGSVTDLGALPLGDGGGDDLSAITSAIGVTP